MSTSTITALQPPEIWRNFADLNAVPRPSKKEERVVAFIQEFGRGLGLPVHTDAAGYFLIKKPASPGLEDRPPVALQAHLDMVHQKNAATHFDFDSEGIRMLVEGDWVRAEGTTLGADNGIGVAAVMALLVSLDIPHPALEALTIDEETGMTSTEAVPQGGLLQAKYMLNLDTEDNRELTIGCAGGVDVVASGCTVCPVPARLRDPAAQRGRPEWRPLGDGNSFGSGQRQQTDEPPLVRRGQEFRRAYLLHRWRRSAQRHSPRIFGAGGDPPRVGGGHAPLCSGTGGHLPERVSDHRPGLPALLSGRSGSGGVLDSDFQTRLLKAIYSSVNGIYRLSPDVAGLVQTSNNLARVLVQNGELSIQCLTRGSVDSEKMDLATSLCCAWELLGADVAVLGGARGWAPRAQALSGDFDERPLPTAVSRLPAGQRLMPAWNAESWARTTRHGDNLFGPNIRGAHSPDERVQISSVQKFWTFLKQILRPIR